MSLYTPFNKWVTDEHKLFTDSVQKFYNDEMSPNICLLYTSPSPRDKRQYRMPSSA